MLQFSLISALFFAAFASTSYQSVFLMETGFTSTQIGIGTSVGGAAGLIVLPVWGMISDKFGSAKPVFMFCMAANGVLYLLFPAVVKTTMGFVWPIYAYIAFTTLFRQPANAMLDSWAVSELTPKGIHYGSVRMWGSIGYSAVSMFLGAMIGKVWKTEAAFYVMLVFIVPLLAICYGQSSGKQDGRQDGKKEKFELRALLHNKKLFVYIFYTVGLNIYLSVTLIYMGYILEAAGCSAKLLGVVTGFRALMEIISMRLSGILRKRWPMWTILLASGILFGVEHLLYRECRGLLPILLVMVLSGLAGGIFYSMGPSYIHEIVEPGVQNTAQSLAGVSMAFTGIVGNLLGGGVVEHYGIFMLTTGCGCLILLLTAVFGFSQCVWNRQSHRVDFY